MTTASATLPPLARSVARLVKDHGTAGDRPASPVSIVWMVRHATGQQIAEYTWSSAIPPDVLDKWNLLTDGFKLGVLTAAACHPINRED